MDGDVERAQWSMHDEPWWGFGVDVIVLAAPDPDSAGLGLKARVARDGADHIVLDMPVGWWGVIECNRSG